MKSQYAPKALTATAVKSMHVIDPQKIVELLLTVMKTCISTTHALVIALNLLESKGKR